MRLKSLSAAAAVAVATTMLAGGAAYAVPVTGTLNLGPTAGTSATVQATSPFQVTFSPSTTNDVFVTSDTGSFATVVLPGTTGNLIDFNTSTTGTLYQIPGTSPLTTFSTSAGMGTLTQLPTGSYSYAYTSNGSITLSGYDNTPGIFTFTAQGTLNDLTITGVSFSATTDSIPAPASLTLFGTALIGLGAFGLLRRKKVA